VKVMSKVTQFSQHMCRTELIAIVEFILLSWNPFPESPQVPPPHAPSAIQGEDLDPVQGA
jgi:hypothetical protein